jgi:hypothetical protein
VNARRWWRPSVGACVWLVFFLAIQLSPRRVELLNDGDACWHWLQGAWMIEHRAVLRSDVLSHTRPGAALVCKDWGSEVLWALAGNRFGWSGIVFVAGALIATTVWLLYRQARTEGAGAWLALALTLLAAWACSSHWLARPHLVTHLFSVLVAWTLRDFDRDRISSWQAGGRLAAWMAVWANFHGGFFNGFVMIALYALGCAASAATGASSERPRLVCKLGVWVALGTVAVAASLVNPNGWRLHAHILNFVRTPALAFSTNEWQPPDLRQPAMYGFAVLLFMIAVVVVKRWSRLRPSDIAMVAGWGLLALRSSRNVAVFAIVTTPVLAEQLTAALGKWRVGWWTRLSARVAAVDAGSGGAAVVSLALVAVLVAMSRSWLVTDLPARSWPAGAVKFLRANGDRVRGQMFNEYIWGGYLAQALPGRQVFIDGRNDFYGVNLITEYWNVVHAQAGWETVLQRHDVGWTILPPHAPLNLALPAAGNWSCVYSDEVAMIWGRTE